MVSTETLTVGIIVKDSYTEYWSNGCWKFSFKSQDKLFFKCTEIENSYFEL